MNILPHETPTTTASSLRSKKSKKNNHQESNRKHSPNFQKVCHATLRDLSKYRPHNLDKLCDRVGGCMGSFPVETGRITGKGFDTPIQAWDKQLMTRKAATNLSYMDSPLFASRISF